MIIIAIANSELLVKKRFLLSSINCIQCHVDYKQSAKEEPKGHRIIKRTVLISCLRLRVNICDFINYFSERDIRMISECQEALPVS